MMTSKRTKQKLTTSQQESSGQEKDEDLQISKKVKLQSETITNTNLQNSTSSSQINSVQNVKNSKITEKQQLVQANTTSGMCAPSEQNLYKLVAFYQNTENYKEYNKLKYKNDLYKLKDIVFIKNVEDMNNDFVGYLSKIILINTQSEVKPIIQVTWYYKKSDLPKKYSIYQNSISDHEVFETDHTDYAYIDTINGPCQVLTYNEYDKLSLIKDNNVYFTRGKYDIKKQKIYDPPIEQWEQSCICKLPINPDLQYICCDICQKWFHIKCMNLTLQQANKIQQWTCQNCQLTK